jgi:hypothetical protein
MIFSFCSFKVVSIAGWAAAVESNTIKAQIVKVVFIR